MMTLRRAFPMALAIVAVLFVTAGGASAQSCNVHIFATNKFGTPITATGTASVGSLPAGEAGPNPVLPDADFIIEATGDSSCRLDATFTFTSTAVQNSCTVHLTTVDPSITDRQPNEPQHEFDPAHEIQSLLTEYVVAEG